MLCVAYILRPDSEGSIQLTWADPDAPLDIDANYFATEHDCTTAVGVLRDMRRLFATGPLAKWIERETLPGPTVQTDQEIIDHQGVFLGSAAVSSSASRRWRRRRSASSWTRVRARR